jgi:methyl-accepting chemotaxis protein
MTHRHTRVATALASGDVSEAATKLSADLRAGLAGESAALTMVFASTAQPLEAIAGSVSSAFEESVLLGASTAGEFTESGDAKSSVAAIAIAGDFKVFGGIGMGLKADPQAAVRQALAGIPSVVRDYPHQTVVILLDALSGTGEEATLITSTLLGSEVRLAGGAAGDDLAMKATRVSHGGRVLGDAVAVAALFSKTPLGLGVCHGHEPLSPPLAITRASGATVHEVAGRPAWDVWRELTRAAALKHGIDVDRMPASDEGAFLLRYEAGLAAGASYKIRAPLSRNADGSINFACGIPEGAIIRITESEPERQVQSAREAAKSARAQLGASDVAGAVVFDCICRNLILGSDFARAVRGMSEELGGAPLAGFETYGEIAMDEGDMSGFHNTTTVVLAFPK